MAIQNRRGNFVDFDPYKMLAGEFAYALDTEELYYCVSPGNVKRCATKEDVIEILETSQEAYDGLQQLLTELEDETVATGILNDIADLDTRVNAHLAESASKHITESGSNDNGNYIKFDDGTMECTKSIPFSDIVVDQAWGSLFISPSTARIQLGAFAHNFIGTPVLNIFLTFTNLYDAWLGAVVGLTSSVGGSTIIIRPTTATGMNGVINVIAKGRWKV